MLGVNNNECCVLKCLLPFDSLVKNEIEASDFEHSCFNWCGHGAIDRTLDGIEMKQTGNAIVLDNPIAFHGKDYDCGHCYNWTFIVKEIHELTPISKD